MSANRYNDALGPLNEAAKKAPRKDFIFFLRAQVHLALDNVADARRDAKTMAALAESQDAVEAVAQLEEMINQGQSAAAISRLLTKAKSALENSQFSVAVQVLDEAAKMAPSVGAIYFLRAQARAGAQDFAGTIKDVQKFEQLADTNEKETARRLKQALLGSGSR